MCDRPRLGSQHTDFLDGSRLVYPCMKDQGLLAPDRIQGYAVIPHYTFTMKKARPTRARFVPSVCRNSGSRVQTRGSYLVPTPPSAGDEFAGPQGL
jgi:hypothetical protein